MQDTTHYPLCNNPEERSYDYATTQLQHSTGTLEMSATGNDPGPFISGGKQIKPWYLSFISLYVEFLMIAMFTFLPRRQK